MKTTTDKPILTYGYLQVGKIVNPPVKITTTEHYKIQWWKNAPCTKPVK